MAPLTHTMYSVCLFTALLVLKQWCARRHRVPLAFRACAVKALCATR